MKGRVSKSHSEYLHFSKKQMVIISSITTWEYCEASEPTRENDNKKDKYDKDLSYIGNNIYVIC